eukprot:CAMPEP_0196769468 /NCGR_PEP_ID=MMETSP1104-20130614/562_1 /TAXON_ID=33652 /ORGANISM="Cafeteria sp., Strain Caron Lab Isolate" /LENGTH=169 /DNA_ID=CAMNT_0042139563 /DNA_START=8 /DNA_END=517 /DNA_ORIENTATION=+
MSAAALRSSLLRRSNALAFSVRKQVPTSMIAVRGKSYTAAQQEKGRPLSPHVTIYKFPVVAMSSITVRATGVGLAAGMSAMGMAALFGTDVTQMMYAFKDAAPLLVPPAKFAVAFGLTYHYLGGLRHVVWDNCPEMLTNEKVEQLSFAMVGAAAGTSLVLTFLTLSPPQ